MRRVLLSAATAFVLLAPGVRLATAATISVGSPIVVSATTIAVPIEITDAAAVTFWQFDLLYDPTDLQINTTCDLFSGDPYCSLLTGPVTEGEFFSSLSSFNVFTPGFITLDPTTFAQAGLLLAVNDTFGGDLPGPSGSGVLAYVEFLVLGDGTSAITVVNPVVSASPVPEPATLTLLMTGIGMLGAASRKRRSSARRHSARPFQA
jgi:hypothetical protein